MSGKICWIKNSLTDVAYFDLITDTALLYGPFLLTISLSVLFLIQALLIIKSFDIDSEQYYNIVKRFAFFPIMFGVSYIANGLYIYMNTKSPSLWIVYIQVFFGKSQGICLVLYQYLVKTSDFIVLWNKLFGRCKHRKISLKEAQDNKVSFFSKFIRSSQTGFATFIGHSELDDNEKYLRNTNSTLLEPK